MNPNLPTNNKALVEELLSNTPYFKEQAFNCRCSLCKQKTGYEYVHHIIVGETIRIREAINQPLRVTSGYRCKNHPKEIVKKTPGAHNRGMAVDVNVYDSKCFAVIEEIIRGDIAKRIGVNQKGNRRGRFIHIQMLDEKQNTSTIFSY